MIIGAINEDAVHQDILAAHERLQTFDNLPPGRFRVSVRLPGADEIRDAHLKVVLSLQGSPAAPWVEASRLMLTRLESKHFNSFDTIFETGSTYNIRVDFMVAHVSPAGEHAARVGMAFASVAHLASAENERLDAPLVDVSGAPIPDAHVELRMQWLRFKNERVVLEAHVRVTRGPGWPFDAVRPFFVLYKWERPVSRWIPIYRSEVLTKGTSFLNAKGILKFELAEILPKTTLDGDHERPLRLEFFHYHGKQKQKMLGYLESSLAQLRQTREHAKMDLRMSTFAEGELVGELKMVTSKISTGRMFFCLEASFGGEVTGSFVYFDIGLSDMKERRGWSPRVGVKKLYYTVARYADSNRWEKIYRSEAAQRFSGKAYRYQVARISERRLNGCTDTRPISVMLFQGVKGKRVPMGHVETSVAALRTASAGTTLTLQGDDGRAGVVRVEQVEQKAGVTYFGLHCVLQTREETSGSTNEGAQQVVDV